MWISTISAVLVCVDISSVDRYLEYLPEVIRVLMILVTLVLEIGSTHVVVVVVVVAVAVDDVVSLFTLSLLMITRICIANTLRNVQVSCHNQELL